MILVTKTSDQVCVCVCLRVFIKLQIELFNGWVGRGYDDPVPGEVTKTAPSGDRTT